MYGNVYLGFISVAIPQDGKRVATDSTSLSVAFSLDAKPPVHCGGNDGARPMAERAPSP
jgi:hypothetical protein